MFCLLAELAFDLLEFFFEQLFGLCFDIQPQQGLGVGQFRLGQFGQGVLWPVGLAPAGLGRGESALKLHELAGARRAEPPAAQAQQVMLSADAAVGQHVADDRAAARCSRFGMHAVMLQAPVRSVNTNPPAPPGRPRRGAGQGVDRYR